jgi:hypothetical protein
MNRRKFALHTAAAIAGTTVASDYAFAIVSRKAKSENEIIGHGNYRYSVHSGWGTQDPQAFPVKNCHEMVMDSRGRLIMVTDEVKNNVIIYNKDGVVVDTWGHDFPGAHGLTLHAEGGEDMLYISDFALGKVFKTTTDGRILLTIDHPAEQGIYKKDDPFKPTETAVAPNGDIYIADGYGSQYVIQYNSKGEYIRHFGGKGDEDHQFSTVHGVAIDSRNPGDITLLCTSRAHNAFKRFSLDGTYRSTIFLPGAFVCRPVIDDQTVYSGVCWSRLRYLNQTPDSGFVTILDADDRVVSNPGGTAPEYRDGTLQLMVQDKPVFKHCHDVCVDEDKNLYVCQWNAGQTYPVKLERV